MTRFRLIPAFLLICLTALALIQIGGCANIVPPSGGPRDSIPPYAVYAKPKDSSTGIAPKEILISFNEYITTNTLQEQLIVSPTIKNNPLVDQRLNMVRIRLSDSLNANTITKALNYIPVPNDYGSFYDTAKQTSTVATANPIKLNFTNFSNNITITNNTSGLPTRITVNNTGLYHIKYTLQFVKTDAANDEVSVWMRRTSAAYSNTNNTYIIAGTGIKNTVSNSFFVELGDNDYIEIYFSVKNINTSLVATNTQLSPSRPATPAATVSIQRIN